MNNNAGGVKQLLVLGGNSDIGMAVAKRFAKEGWSIVLAGRDEIMLAANEIKLMAIGGGGRIESCFCDVEDIGNHEIFLSSLDRMPDVVLSAVGFMKDQDALNDDVVLAARTLAANFSGPALLLNAIGLRMAKDKSGVLVGISSVAGERGRGSNYLYGSAKAGFTAFLSGLRNKLHPVGVRVITVLPGFVDTKMVADLDLPKALLASPGRVAETVWKSVNGGCEVVYVLPVWRVIMAVIRAIPEAIFKRLSL